MPSIDLDALRRWSQALGDQIAEPQAFAAALKGQFESHSNRLLRRGRSLARHGALPSWNIPAAMLNEIEAVILPRAARQPEAALRLADHLWAIPWLEEKSLAARLLEAAARPEASHMRLARWVLQTPDRSLLEILARHAARPVRRESPDLFRQEILTWLGERSLAGRRFAWLALREWMDETPSSAALLAFEVLARGMREDDPECVRSSQAVFAQLAASQPAELLRWLDDLPDRDTLFIGRRWLRGALPGLPPEIRDAVRARMAPDEVGVRREG
jgi:hypothetical protein